MPDFVRSLLYLTETTDTFQVWFRGETELIPAGQGAPPQNPPTAAAGGSCGRLWGKAVLASTSSQRASPPPPATAHPRSRLPPLLSRAHAQSTAHPCPSGPHVPGAGWRHPASSRTLDVVNPFIGQDRTSIWLPFVVNHYQDNTFFYRLSALSLTTYEKSVLHF